MILSSIDWKLYIHKSYSVRLHSILTIDNTFLPDFQYKSETISDQ